MSMINNLCHSLPNRQTQLRYLLVLSGGVACVITCKRLQNSAVVAEFWMRSLRSLRLFRRSVIVKLQTLVLTKFSSNIREDIRPFFRQLQLHNNSKRTNHSHGDAAASRASVRGLIQQFEVVVGREVFYLSMSEGERAAGKLGSKEYHFAKDMLAESKIATPKSQQVIALVDVDYYLNMESFLSSNDYIIYTTLPTSVGGAVDNGNFCFKGDQYTLVVNGGARYEHRLWNYNTDVLFVWKWYGGELFNVEFKRVNHHRVIVLLNHRRTVYTPLAWICFNEQTLRPLTVNNGKGMNHLRVLRSNGVLEHHLAPDGVAVDTCITEADFNSLRMRLSTSKTPQLSDAERILRNSDNKETALTDAAILFEYFQLEGTLNQTLVSEGIQDNYQTLYPLVTEDGKPTVRRIATPLLDEGVAPMKSYNNDVACVDGRIDRVKNQVTTYPNFYYQVMGEYVDFLVPAGVRNTLVPLDFDAMDAKLIRPTQKSLIERFKNYMFYTKPCSVSSFQKAEVYGKITDPRNISTLPMNHNFRLGQFSYELSERVFKQTHWYAFGSHPMVLSQKVVDAALNKVSVVPSDISKLDGSAGKIYHDLDVATVRRAFNERYVVEVLGLLETEKVIKGYTSHRVEYLAEYNTLSGSSRTSWRNSNANAYTIYLARRLAGETPMQAWSGLGLYGGDDGITFDFPAQNINRTFAKLGLLAKSEELKIDSSVPFLGRIFLNPWVNGHSFADVPRQLRKLHLTVAPKTVADDVVLYRKAVGYRITDANTPFLTAWSNKIIEITGGPNGTLVISEHDRKLTNGDVSYWERFENPFEPLTHAEYDVACGIIAEQLDVTATELVEKIRAIGKAKTVKEVFSVASFRAEVKVEVDVTYRGQLRKGRRPDHQEEVKKNKKKVNIITKPATSKPKGTVKTVWKTKSSKVQ